MKLQQNDFKMPQTIGKKGAEKRQLRQSSLSQIGFVNKLSNKKTVMTSNKIFLEDSQKANIKVFTLVSDEETFPIIHQNELFKHCNMKLYQKQKVLKHSFYYCYRSATTKLTRKCSSRQRLCC